ncbi:hypothetical protein AAAC05_05680 [Pseudomonas aeruginosa]|uniref:hypothetical protein n=1 Tax=Pseudomonas aeruginosa TaxID=287 RepID=UPI0030F1D2F1
MSSRQSSRNASTPYLAKAFQATAIVVVSYFLYWTYQLYQYGEIPISKKDVMLRQAILARFPADYEVEIKGADLLGFGEKFLVAYGNRRFVGKAFAMDDQVIERLERNQGRTNLPLVKVFYIAEPGLLSSLLNLSPFLDIQKNMVELSLREYRKIQLVPFDPDAKRKPREQFETDYAFPQLFSLSQMEVADYDGDGRDELRLGYLSYAGGSGGTRWSVIYDLKDGALTAHSGYPEMLDIDVARFIQAVNLYAGLDGTLPRDQRQLEDVVGRGSERFALTAAERQALVADPPQRDDYARVLMSLSPRSPYAPDRFIDLGDGSRLTLAPRHTDDYSTFLDIGGKKIFVEAFYVDDDACHWCEHRWRVMAFHYDDGRWISDRTINGDSFNGQWLRNAEAAGPQRRFRHLPRPGPGGPGLVLHRPALDRLQPA